MAISAIDLFRPQPLDGVGQLLSGANNVLAQALSSAVQIGRDSSSLRATQEREVLAERERIANLEQRRAEDFNKNYAIDRAFNEGVTQDRRDFAEGVRRDNRNFDESARRDTRDYALKEYGTLSSILNAEEDNTLNRERLDLEKENTTLKKDALRKEADLITAPTKEPSFIAKLFGVDNAPLPDDDVRNGKRAVDIGRLLGDPTIIQKGDDLITRGTKGVLQRKEDIRNEPRPARPSTARSKTPSVDELEEIANKDAAVIGIPKEDLLALPLSDVAKLLNGDTVGGKFSAGDFTDSQRDRLLLNIQRLKAARAAGKTPAGAPAAQAPTPSAAQSYFDRTKKK